MTGMTIVMWGYYGMRLVCLGSSTMALPQYSLVTKGTSRVLAGFYDLFFFIKGVSAEMPYLSTSWLLLNP